MKEEEILSLTIDRLTIDDISNISWSGTPTHIKYVKEALERVDRKEVDYLAVRDVNNNPIAIGGVDYVVHKNAGTLWQIVVMESLRGLGIGKRLIQELENKIKARGLNIAMLGVEKDNIVAQNLYSKLGYEVCGDTEDSWEAEDKDGNISTHHAKGILMRKVL
jgi:ribosomal protein S18 acetylase RimI-like enzyme